MRQIFPFLALPLAATASFATEPVDSLPDHTLGEVVIEAPRIIRKADRDVYRPSKSAVEHSANGVQLLRNLMIHSAPYQLPENPSSSGSTDARPPSTR